METYQISEVQDINSRREPFIIQAKDLAQAKRAARRLKVFQGTRMVIRDQSGDIVAYTDMYDRWQNKLLF